MGLARAVSGIALPAHLLRLHSPQAERVADLGEDEGGRQRIQATTHRFLLQGTEQQVCAAGPAWSHGWPRRGLVYGTVLRALLPHHHAEGRPPAGVLDDRLVAAYRHTLLCVLRLVQRQNRA